LNPSRPHLHANPPSSLPPAQESFIDIIKHFSEEIRVESHYLLTQAMKFKVTSHLLNDIERMYIKEEL